MNRKSVLNSLADNKRMSINKGNLQIDIPENEFINDPEIDVEINQENNSFDEIERLVDTKDLR